MRQDRTIQNYFQSVLLLSIHSRLPWAMGPANNCYCAKLTVQVLWIKTFKAPGSAGYQTTGLQEGLLWTAWGFKWWNGWRIWTDWLNGWMAMRARSSRSSLSYLSCQRLWATLFTSSLGYGSIQNFSACSLRFFLLKPLQWHLCQDFEPFG